MIPTTESMLRCLLRRVDGAVELDLGELAQPGSILLTETPEGVHLELIEL